MTTHQEPDFIRNLRAEAEARAAERDAGRQRRLAQRSDFVYDKSQEKFWDTLDNTLHSEKAVDASIPLSEWTVEVDEGGPAAGGGRGRPRARRERLIPPSREIMRVENDQFVEGSTWWPGMPKIIRDYFIDANGAYPAIGRRSFNQYREPPSFPDADPSDAALWVEHVKRLWPDPVEHEFLFDYCAHMVQRPHEKCNAAIVMAGAQGIGKDSALIPIKAAVGVWNTKEVEPDQLFETFRPWLQTLLLTVNEVRTSKDEHQASSMYNIMKPLIAAPPETLPLNDKHQKLRYVINVLRVFITTNEPHAMFIPEDDRRMMIMHSGLAPKWHMESDPDYFKRLYDYFDRGGIAAVAAWLRARDVSAFDPKASPPRTSGWGNVAASWEAPDDVVTRLMEKLGRPPVVFSQELTTNAGLDDDDEVHALLKSPRKLAYRLQKEGYVLRKRPDAKERWHFEAEGRRFRSRAAFVLDSLVNDPRRADAEIERRGKMLAAAAKPKEST